MSARCEHEEANGLERRCCLDAGHAGAHRFYAAPITAATRRHRVESRPEPSALRIQRAAPELLEALRRAECALRNIAANRLAIERGEISADRGIDSDNIMDAAYEAQAAIAKAEDGEV
jgi:hypothetical protein